MGGQNGADVPDPPPACFGGEVHSKARVAVQFRLDRLQENRGLFQRVGNDQDVAFTPGKNAPQHEKQGDKCAFRFAARSGRGDVLAFAGFGHARQGGVKPCMQRAVAGDRAVVREVRAPEKDKVGKRLFPALGGSLGIGREALAISFDLLLQGGGNVGKRVPELFMESFFHFPYSFSTRSPNGSSTSKSAEACCGKCLIVKSASILIRLVDVLSLVYSR